jgi:hypothetical protein
MGTWKPFQNRVWDSQVIIQSAYLRYEVLLNPLQLGPLPAIFCHQSLFIELMSQVPILIIVKRANTHTHKIRYWKVFR